MPVSQDIIWTIIFTIGSAQGIFLAVLLYHRQSPNRLASALLSGLVLVFSLGMLEELVEVAHQVNQLPHVLLSTTTLAFLIGPFLFLYGRILITGKSALQWIDVLHFVPFVIGTLFFVPFYRLSGPDKIEALGNGEMATLIVVFASLKAVHLLPYFAAIILAQIKAWRHIERYSSPEKRRLTWYRNSTVAILLTALTSLILYFWSLWGPIDLDSDYVTYTMLTLVIYAWATAAVRNPELMFLRRWETNTMPVSKTAIKQENAPYASSALSESEKADLVRRIRAYMEAEKPYLDPDLRRDDLARALGLSLHHFSQVLNQSMNMKYGAFINSYRIAEFKDRTRDPEHQHKTILALAYESGFKSKTTFNRVFKQQEGLTAKEFRARGADSGPIRSHGSNMA